MLSPRSKWGLSLTRPSARTVVAWLQRPIVGASLLLTALTVMLTWPQALHMGSLRLAVSRSTAEHLAVVVARPRPEGRPGPSVRRQHLLPESGTRLPIPTRRFSRGSSPRRGSGRTSTPSRVYNVLLLAGIVSSGIGMFVLVRYLTGNLDAALVSAAIFTLVPYRVEHFMHLELQWTIWMPLSMWAVHRAFDRGTVRSGLWVGLLAVAPGALLRLLRRVSRRHRRRARRFSW